MLSRRMDEQVNIRISRKHQADPELRFKDTCDSLCESQELHCAFIVLNAASDIEITANLERRTVTCSMWLKRTRSQETSQCEDQLAGPTVAQCRR